MPFLSLTRARCLVRPGPKDPFRWSPAGTNAKHADPDRNGRRETAPGGIQAGRGGNAREWGASLRYFPTWGVPLAQRCPVLRRASGDRGIHWWFIHRHAAERPKSRMRAYLSQHPRPAIARILSDSHHMCIMCRFLRGGTSYSTSPPGGAGSPRRPHDRDPADAGLRRHAGA